MTEPATSAFAASLSAAAPPADWPAPLAALWWAAGSHDAGWDRAHALVQDATGTEAAWVHAHLHRVEGDLANAAYWYRRAGRPAAQGSVEQERATIAAALMPAS